MIDTKNLPATRVADARAVSQALLDELELGSSPIINSIMKAKRLARLLRDGDAELWLDLEARGYPKSFNSSKLGSCEKYAVAGGRVLEDRKYYLPSLPQFEAGLRTAEKSLDAIRFPTNIAPSVSSSNPNELTGIHISNAIGKVTDAYKVALDAARNQYDHNVRMFNGLKSALHSYATDCHHALSFGDAAEGLFEQARADVDRFIRQVAPKAAEQLVAAFERYDSGEEEALSHALTSVRRLLSTVADAIFPPQAEPITDRAGKRRKVGTEEYKNRLLAFIEKRQTSQSTTAILAAELEHLAARLDAFYEKSCKGVHADVTATEVRLVLISAYMFLAEVVRVADTDAKDSTVRDETSTASIEPPVEMAPTPTDEGTSDPSAN